MKGELLSPKIKNNATDKDQSLTEYIELLVIFERLLEDYDDYQEQLIAIEELITMRSSYLIDRVLMCFGMDFDKAITILRNHNNFTTQQEQDLREILVAAVDNLVDFSAAQEFTAFEEIGFDKDIESREYCIEVFEKYNLTYAIQENSDVLYSSMIAAWWLSVPNDSTVTFMTQADERVRSWHLSHEGLSFPKHQFPPELIPPIEWGCRCFLTADGFHSVVGNLKTTKIKYSTDPIFNESLATKGRIFSSEHSYFNREISADVKRIVENIKHKLFIRP